MDVNLSRAAEERVKAAVAEAKSERWAINKSEALKSSNAYVEKYGLPLDKYRQFLWLDLISTRV